MLRTWTGHLRMQFLFLSLEHIADTMDSQDITWLFGIFFNLISEMRNVNMDIVDTSPVFITPDIGKDMIKSQHLTGITCQINQQAELNRRELNPFLIHQHMSPFNINTEVAIIEMKICILSI